MGDFVDRGFYSVETFLLLLALKVHINIILLNRDLVLNYHIPGEVCVCVDCKSLEALRKYT